VLYKYLPRRFAAPFVANGEILFRTLSYFRRVEHAARGDEVEGVHVDDPKRDVRLDVVGGPHVIGRYRYLNSVDQTKVYAFCCSDRLSVELFDMFDADACVVIKDPVQFFLRCQTAARRAFPVDRLRLIHRPVAYWKTSHEAPLSVKDPDSLPFLKHEAFAPQCEYRGVFARRGGRELVQRIVQPQFTFREEIESASVHERLFRIGDISAIAELVDRSSAK